MADPLVLDRAAVEELLDLDALLAALPDAFRQLSTGAASVPPRVAAVAPDGLLGAMPVHLPGAGLVAKLVTVFPGNHAAGRPSHQALLAVFDPADGALLALLDGTHVTAVRTGAAAAVAADVLARPDAAVLAILGAGVQGGSHLDAFTRVRDFTEIRIASRTPEHAVALAARHPAARAVGSFEAAVAGADVVCCCTDARTPVVDRAWFAPGAHVSSVGGSFGPELDEGTVGAGLVVVEWRGAVTKAPPAGAHELQGLDPEAVVELGEILSGRRPGRTSPDQLTVWKSTGHAVEDAAAAALVLRAARQRVIGTSVPL